MNKKHEAQQLYMNGCRTQKEIADIIGVSERTVHTWIHQYAWDKLRLAAYHAPATIVDNLCSQIVELQNAIARKEPGARYATPQEAEVMRKLIVCMEKMKKTPSLSQNMQMLETFRAYVRPIDKDFTKKLSGYTSKFLNAKASNGYAPYQAEYGVEPVPPLSHIYDEIPEAIPQKDALSIVPDLFAAAEACASNKQCLHKGDCTYPKCLHPERYAEPTDPITPYRTTRVLDLIPPEPNEDLPVTTGNFLEIQEEIITIAYQPGDRSMDPATPPAASERSSRSNSAIPQYKTAENKEIATPEDWNKTKILRA